MDTTHLNSTGHMWWDPIVGLIIAIFLIKINNYFEFSPKSLSSTQTFEFFSELEAYKH